MSGKLLVRLIFRAMILTLILFLFDACSEKQDSLLEPYRDKPLEGATFTTLWDFDYPRETTELKVWTYEFPISIGSSDKIRSPGTKSVHFDYKKGGGRAEIFTDYNYLGVGEGSIVYMGWSDLYVNAPLTKYTVFQWRDQNRNIPGCPVIQFVMAGSYESFGGSLGTVNGIVVIIKEALAAQGIILSNLKINVWYDFVIGMKYSKNGDGYFKVWAGEAGKLDYKNPVFVYNGPTMYSERDLGTMTEPCGYDASWGDCFNEPQLRMGGCYMWGEDADFESYKGPLRINIGEDGKTAFLKVMPR